MRERAATGRRLRGAAALVVTTTMVVLAAHRAAGQKYPIFTAVELDKTMASVGQNFGALVRMVSAGELEDAKARAVRTREQLATTITFWRDHKRDDAIALLRAATAKLDELDTVLSAERVDQGAARARLDEVRAACEACHTKYREQDPATKAYRVKTGVLP